MSELQVYKPEEIFVKLPTGQIVPLVSVQQQAIEQRHPVHYYQGAANNERVNSAYKALFAFGGVVIFGTIGLFILFAALKFLTTPTVIQQPEVHCPWIGTCSTR